MRRRRSRRRRRRDEAPRQEVDRNRGEAHQIALEVLDQRGAAAWEPTTTGAIRYAYNDLWARLAEPRRGRCRDRTRKLSPLELVAEDRRRLAAIASHRLARATSIATIATGRSGWREQLAVGQRRSACAFSLGPERPGRRAGRGRSRVVRTCRRPRRRRRQRRSRRAFAWASGIVTSTMSGVVRARSAAISCVPAERRARRGRGGAAAWVVVDEAEDALAAGLAQLAHEAAAGAARPDDQCPSPVRSRIGRVPPDDRALGEPRDARSPPRRTVRR